MKKNKTYTIIKRLIIQTIIVSLLFGIISVIYFKWDYRNWAYSNIEAQERINNSIIQAVENIGYERNIIHNVMNSDRLILSSTANNFEQGQFYARITDKAEFAIADSKERCFFVLPAEEINYEDSGYSFAASPRIYINEDENLIKWMNTAQDEYNKKTDEKESRELFFSVNTYATNGDYFYPTNIMVFNNSLMNAGEMFAIDKDNFESAQIELNIQDYISNANAGDLQIIENEYDSAVAYLIGSKTDVKDYLLNEGDDLKNYYACYGTGYSKEIGPYDDINYRYNKSFIKGDFVCILKVPFICSSISDDNKDDSSSKEYLMETYYKANYWEINGRETLNRILIAYGILFLISSLISVICSLKVIVKAEREQFKNTLMDSISHDLKSPLTALRGYAESLKENLNADRKEEYADAILESSDYMDRLINGNLELLRLEDTRKTGKKENVDLVDLTKGLYEKYLPSLDERGITLNITGKYLKKVDRSLISNAIENLVSNSVKYVNDFGEITVKGTEKGFEIVNTVEELPKKKPEDLWETLVKGDDSRTNEKGSGIGLAIAKRIFDIHKIKAHTQYADGDPKEFKVTLS